MLPRKPFSVAANVEEVSNIATNFTKAGNIAVVSDINLLLVLIILMIISNFINNIKSISQMLTRLPIDVTVNVCNVRDVAYNREQSKH